MSVKAYCSLFQLVTRISKLWKLEIESKKVASSIQVGDCEGVWGRSKGNVVK